jgi:hypothetical protein
VARRETVAYTDDLDESTDDVQTVRLAYGNKTVDIDLGAKNRAKLEKYLAPLPRCRHEGQYLSVTSDQGCTQGGRERRRHS